MQELQAGLGLDASYSAAWLEMAAWWSLKMRGGGHKREFAQGRC